MEALIQFIAEGHNEYIIRSFLLGILFGMVFVLAIVFFVIGMGWLQLKRVVKESIPFRQHSKLWK